jgi:glycosyltransferase involved in cell wall biosynthesis
MTVPKPAPSSVVYFGLYDPREAPGVHRKVMGVLSAAKDAGFETRAWAEPFSKSAPLKRLAAAITAAPETHMILRSQGWANMFLWWALRRARRRGVIVTIDVPSPHAVAIREVWGSPQSLGRRLRTVAAYYVSGPWVLWPATRIVQYAPEGWWFSIGNRDRTVQIGNGIDVSAIEPRRSAPPWSAACLQIIAVASIARWQGYDRLLHALRQFLDRPGRTFDAHVTIVGDGPDLAALRSLAATLGLERAVTFTGTLTGDALRRLYESSHIAVSTLALHRKGLSSASELKAREYCAIGIPFIACGDDPDFPHDQPFRVRVANDDRPDDVVAVMADFGRHHQRFDDAAQRRYAVDHLDWRHKLSALGLTR